MVNWMDVVMSTTPSSQEGGKPRLCGRFCPLREELPVCGSDGKTYSSRCHLDNESCRDESITFKHHGECDEEKGETSSRCTSEVTKDNQGQVRGTHEVSIRIPENSKQATALSKSTQVFYKSAPEPASSTTAAPKGPAEPVQQPDPGNLPSPEQNNEPGEDEKKRSASTLEAPDDERRHLKGNEDRVKENQLRQKLMYDDPKCNIEKESKLLQMPQSQGRDNRIPEHAMLPPTPAGFTPIMAAPPSLLGYPPIITHTAATPQGSPHATLESCGRGELNNRLTPAMALYGSVWHYVRSAGTSSGRLEVSFDKEQQHNILSIISNLKSPGVPRFTQTRVPLPPRPARPPGLHQSISWPGAEREWRRLSAVLEKERVPAPATRIQHERRVVPAIASRQGEPSLSGLGLGIRRGGRDGPQQQHHLH
ncbi:Turripeptide [Penaeus vannamei]|uniref:Turripeptide n=1 Tax=Penaeus vannamei TaxID=6689 RepID=A0A423T526_PENVA|nr:Turripeptide [Penaeus vannamei]